MASTVKAEILNRCWASGALPVTQLECADYRRDDVDLIFSRVGQSGSSLWTHGSMLPAKKYLSSVHSVWGFYHTSRCWPFQSNNKKTSLPGQGLVQEDDFVCKGSMTRRHKCGLTKRTNLDIPMPYRNLAISFTLVTYISLEVNCDRALTNFVGPLNWSWRTEEHTELTSECHSFLTDTFLFLGSYRIKSSLFWGLRFSEVDVHVSCLQQWIDSHFFRLFHSLPLNLLLM